MTASPSPVLDRVVDGRYRVEEHLARGGMASVYRATDLRLDRQVALKVMHPDLARDPEFVARFEREARSAARLSHPHVVSVFDQGEDGDLVFLAMELVQGHTLREVISGDAPLPVREAVRHLEPVLQALAAAHEAGLVHRDVKPENVLIHRTGAIKVADFGLARAVGTSTMSRTSDLLWGTAAYLAPEQVEHGRADARSDVYAAGLLLFEVLTGAKAFPGDNALQVAYQHVHGAVPRAVDLVPTVPAELDRVIQWACATDPDARPADAGELLRGLRDAVRQLSDEELDADPHGAPRATGPDAEAGDGSHGGDPTVRVAATQAVRGTATTALPRERPGEGSYARTTGNRTAKPARQPRPARPGRRRRALGWLLGILLLLLAGTGAAAAWWFTEGPGVHSPVPTLVGLTEQDATAALRGEQLDPVVEPDYSEDVAAGRVISADREPGEVVRHGTDVTLVVSQGPERYAVPPLVGQDVQQARAALEDARLAVGDVSEEHSETAPAGQVLRASQQAGTPLPPGTGVDLVVSAGPAPIEVPDVTGDPVEQATSVLEEAGFTVEVDPERVFHDDVPEGAVASQSPQDGTGFRGDTVRLVVSQGPETVEVPSLIGMQFTQAESVLTDLGLEVVREDLAGGYFGTVRFQSVDPGEQVTKGTEITLTVL